MQVQQLNQRRLKAIPVELIRSSSEPSREVFEDIEPLAATIKEHGLLEPILVRPGKDQYGFELILGERRLRACRKVGLKHVPCIVMDDGVSEDQVLAMQLVENIQRADLKVFELVKLIEMLKDRWQLTNDEIAVKTGLSATTVSEYLTIAKGLPKEYIRVVAHGSHSPKDLTLTKALALAKANLPGDKLKETVELIKKKGLSRRALTKKLASEEKSKLKRVVTGNEFWKELTRSLRDYAVYWKEYCKLKEWADVRAHHLTLEVTMPKDLKDG